MDPISTDPAEATESGCRANTGVRSEAYRRLSPVPITDAGQAAADPSAIFRELWAINGPFEEAWMSAFNAEIWGAGNRGRMQLDFMNNENNGNGNGKLAALQKRIDTAREKMAAEQERLRERQKHETEKLYRLVGEACCKAAGDADFAPVLHRVLDRVTDAKARRFLTGKGMF